MIVSVRFLLLVSLSCVTSAEGEQLTRFNVAGLSLLLPSEPKGGDKYFYCDHPSDSISVSVSLYEPPYFGSAGDGAANWIKAASRNPKVEVRGSSILDSSVGDLEAKQVKLIVQDRREDVVRDTVNYRLYISGENKTWAVQVSGETDSSFKVEEAKKRIFESITILREGWQEPKKEEKLRHLPTDKRPENGANVDNLTLSSAKGELTIRNGRKSDAHVKVICFGKTQYEAYIRASDRIVIDGIPDGSYRLLFAFGYGWDSDSQKFDRGREAFEFDSSLKFSTYTLGDTIFYDKQSVTLYSVIGGNASTSEISIEEFDKY